MNPHCPVAAERARHRCEYCHAPEAIFNVPFEVVHIIPLSKGGLDEESNWALACRACNLNRSDLVDGLDPLTQQHVRLFHPRRDDWPGHFAVEVAEAAWGERAAAFVTSWDEPQRHEAHKGKRRVADSPNKESQ